jgi:hypothetical protein
MTSAAVIVTATSGERPLRTSHPNSGAASAVRNSARPIGARIGAAQFAR